MKWVNAPIMQVGGRSMGACPLASRAALVPASQPQQQLRIPLGSRDLAGGEQSLSTSELKRGLQQFWCFQKGVAVHHTKANELGLFSPGIMRSTRFCSPHLRFV